MKNWTREESELVLRHLDAGDPDYAAHKAQADAHAAREEFGRHLRSLDAQDAAHRSQEQEQEEA